MQSNKGNPKLRLVTVSGKEYTLEFITPEKGQSQRDTLRDTLASFMSLQLSQSPGKSSSISISSELLDATSRSSTPLAAEFQGVTKLALEQELKLRAELLRKYRTLSRLHQDLVRAGIVSEYEFWKSRKVCTTIWTSKDCILKSLQFIHLGFLVCSIYWKQLQLKLFSKEARPQHGWLTCVRFPTKAPKLNIP
jgi:hypothetical protein